MSGIPKAIAMLAIGGTRQPDGTLDIGGETFGEFPEQITVEGFTFDLSETEELDAETGYSLGHYFKKEQN
jgi:hypothetical protein